MAIQRCAQCGTARRGDLQVCVRCETAFPTADAITDVELALPRPAAPSPTQSHGTVLVALLVGFVVFGLLLSVSTRHLGPFSGHVVSVQTNGVHGSVTVTVSNDGSRRGRANCNVTVTDADGVARRGTRFTTTPIAPKLSISQVVEVLLPDGARPTGVSC
ncbi:MAG: hypothetical protein ABR520_05965 [Mycobacteriales bacterium]|nr:hypothetical protein [Frankia sp.]